MAIKMKGIDVSKHQGEIDWKKVKADGIEFAMLRAGYGKVASQEDPTFKRNYEEAKANGIKVGAYWYSYATTASDAKKEAEVCASVLKGKSFDFPIAFDFEDKSQLSKEIASAVIPAFIDTLKSKGYYTILYSYKSMLASYIDDEIEKKYDIWLAHYVKTTSYKGHKMWQYSSSGKVNGISGNVDLDWCYVDYPSIIKGKTTTGEEKTPPQKPTAPDPKATYRVYTGKWLGEISGYNNINSNGYAGIEQKPIYGVTAKSSIGKLRYRVHTRNGRWLPWVSGYSTSDWNKGIAGSLGKIIDGVQFDLLNANGYTVKYRASINGTKNYLPWVMGTKDFAGIINGRNFIDKIQIEIVKK